MWHLQQWHNPLPTPFAPSMSRELAREAADPSQDTRFPSRPSGHPSCVGCSVCIFTFLVNQWCRMWPCGVLRLSWTLCWTPSPSSSPSWKVTSPDSCQRTRGPSRSHPAPGGQAQEGSASAYILPTLAHVPTTRPLFVICAAWSLQMCMCHPSLTPPPALEPVPSLEAAHL